MSEDKSALACNALRVRRATTLEIPAIDDKPLSYKVTLQQRPLWISYIGYGESIEDAILDARVKLDNAEDMYK